MVAGQLLIILEKIAAFKADDADERRGRYYFSNEPCINFLIK